LDAFDTFDAFDAFDTVEPPTVPDNASPPPADVPASGRPSFNPRAFPFAAFPVAFAPNILAQDNGPAKSSTKPVKYHATSTPHPVLARPTESCSATMQRTFPTLRPSSLPIMRITAK
jgi:hypothetical protein